MSKGRQRWNLICSEMQKNHQPSWYQKSTPEEWVYSVVKKTVTGSRDGMLHHEDVASEVLLRALDQGCASWSLERLTDFARDECRKICGTHFWRKERTNSELCDEDQDIHPCFNRGSQPASQETYLLAQEARAILRNLPVAHRLAIETLADGGNPVEIAEEQSISVPEAMVIIREARHFARLVDVN